MSTQLLDYGAIIADLEAKKAAIEATIASLRSVMSWGGGEAPMGGSPSGASSIYGTEVPAGAFLGKSIPEAARIYLEIVKKKQTSREIAEALQKGGMESNSGNFIGIVHAVLDRSRKTPNAAIVKLGTQWGLAGWYPKGILNNAAVAASPSKKKKAKKAKKPASKAAAPAAAAQPPAAEESLESRIFEYAKQHLGEVVNYKQVANALPGAHPKVVALLLGKMAKKFGWNKTTDGGYHIMGKVQGAA